MPDNELRVFYDHNTMHTIIVAGSMAYSYYGYHTDDPYKTAIETLKRPYSCLSPDQACNEVFPDQPNKNQKQLPPTKVDKQETDNINTDTGKAID